MRRRRLYLIAVAPWTPAMPVITPPIGVLYLAAYARSKLPVDVGVCFQKLERLGTEDLVKRAVAFEPDVIGLSCMTTGSHVLPALTSGLKQVLPDCKIILGGAHVSSLGEASMEGNSVDVAVPGEGELALESILQCETEEDLAAVPDIYYRGKEGEVVHTEGQRPFIAEVDSLPMPAYDLIDVPRMWKYLGWSPRHKGYISLFSSRGCPYGCIFCHNVFGKRYRAHSVERILDEIQYFQKRYDLEEVEFLDDTFNLSAERVMSFCEGMGQRNIDILLHFPQLRADSLDEEQIDALCSVGTYCVTFGPETGSPRLQKYIRKNMDLDKFLANTELFDSRKVYVRGYFMLGFPTETEQEMRMTADLACRSRLHWATFFRLVPFPGTKVYEIVKQEHPERLEGIDVRNVSYETVGSSCGDVPRDRIKALQRQAYRRFYLNPRRIVSILRYHPRWRSLLQYAPVLLRHYLEST